MAIARGQKSAEGSVIKRYVGIAPVKVLGVNMKKEELEKVYDTVLENEPSYVSEQDGTKSARVSFVVATDPERSKGIDLTTTVTFFVREEFNYNKDKTKVQVIDRFGDTAWATIEEAKNKTIPVYSSGKPANIDADFRPAFVGEEELTKFIKMYLSIPNHLAYVNGAWVKNPKANEEDCLVRLDEISNYFKGDFKELKSICQYQVDNMIKVLFGVRTTDDGKEYQAVYTRNFLYLSSREAAVEKLKKEVTERQSMGSMPTTVFDFGELHEYVVKPDVVEQATPVDTPNPWEELNF